MGANHLRVLRDLGDDAAQLVAVAEPDNAVRERAIRRFGATGFSDYRAMVEQAKPDLVVVAAPTRAVETWASHTARMFRAPVATARDWLSTRQTVLHLDSDLSKRAGSLRRIAGGAEPAGTEGSG